MQKRHPGLPLGTVLKNQSKARHNPPITLMSWPIAFICSEQESTLCKSDKSSVEKKNQRVKAMQTVKDLPSLKSEGGQVICSGQGADGTWNSAFGFWLRVTSSQRCSCGSRGGLQTPLPVIFALTSFLQKKIEMQSHHWETFSFLKP